MALSKKDKKEARRQRQDQRQSREKAIRAHLAAEAEAGTEQNIVYVLPEDAAVTGAPPPPPADGDAAAGEANPNENENEDEDEDRVELPATVGTSAPMTRPRSARRGAKLSWEALKLAVASRYGQEVSAVVEEHDGNAVDPLFTVAMKTVRGSVPVPRHWSQLRAFLATQTDRERAVDLIPAEIAALGVERIRATRDRRANPDQVAFITCFITGTPLRRKRFRAALSRFGEVFYEGRWTARTQHEPGRLSPSLRAALGMGPHAPPPWLYGMQAMRRLPPAYPALRVPGLNAPIPPGAQWGSGEGQWGQPPRNEHNTFLFPGVMDEAAATADESPPAHWGSVPPLANTRTAAQVPTQQQQQQQQNQQQQQQQQQQQVARPAQGPTKSAPVVAPVPFHPQAYTPAAAMRYVPTTPQEYVRVQDSTAGATVALGSVLVPKRAMGPPGTHPTQPPQPSPSSRPPPSS